MFKLKIGKRAGIRSVVILLLLLPLLFIPSALAPAPQEGHNCIDGIDQWETSFAALNVTPCVVDSIRSIRGQDFYVQYGNLTWKGAPTNIDIAFQFDKTMPNSGLDLWQNISHPSTVSNCTSSKQEFFNATNSSFYNITTSTCNPYVVQNFFFDWNDKTNLMSHQSYNGDSYYFITNIAAATNQLFRARLRFAKSDVPFGTSLKWGLLGKLTVDSLSTAISTGRYAKLDPVVNNTAFNVTSNSDLNLSGKCKPNCASLVDGVIVGGAGNRSNLTGWQTWSNNTLGAWSIFNHSGAADANNFMATGADNGKLNVTTRAGSGSNTWTSVMHPVNISLPASGIAIVVRINTTLWTSGNFHPLICFDTSWDRVINDTAFQECNLPATAGTKALMLFYEAAASGYRIAKMDGGSGTVISTFGSSPGLGAELFTFYVSPTKVRGIVVSQGGGVSDSGDITHSVAGIESGKVSLDVYHGVVTTFQNTLFDNFSIYNTTTFGQPINLTPAVLETNVLNDTIVATSVKVTNLTYYYAPGSAATFQIFDANHGNTQFTNEGGFNSTIASITGVGGNITLFPPSSGANITASEFTSFLYEWNAPAEPTVTVNVSLPAVNVSLWNSTSDDARVILKSRQLFFHTNYSNNLTRTENDSTFKWFTNNTNQSQGGNKTAELVPLIYKGAVAYWHFDSVNGSNITFDGGGKGNNGNLSGFNQSNATTTGIIGGGLKFDGVDDYVSLGNPRLFGGNVSNASMAFWVKPADNWNTDSKRDFIFADIASSVGIQLSAMEDNGDLRIVAGNSSQDTAFFTDANWKKDAWTHIVIAYNGTHFLFYQDGVLGSVNATTLRSIGESESTTATIGATSNTLNGTLDEFVIYNRSLTASEVKQLYLRTWYDYSPQLFLLHPENATFSGTVNFTSSDRELPTTVSGAVYQIGRYSDEPIVDVANTTGYWKFDEGSGSTAADSSTYGKAGTITGAIYTNDALNGSALSFDGNNDYVDYGTFNLDWDSINFTVLAWVKQVNYNTYSGIFGNRFGAGADNWWTFGINDGGGLQIEFGNATSQFNVITDTFPKGKGWEHYVMRKTGRTAEIFRNGILNGSGTIPAGRNIGGTTNDLRSGIWLSANQVLNGSIDEGRIFNRSLSDAEILADYRRYTGGMGLLNNSYINYSAAGNFNEREGTVEFWVKPKWNGNDGSAHVFFNTENAADFNITKSSGNDVTVQSGGTVLLKANAANWVSGRWQHVAVTWNNYTSNSTAHINGLQINNSGTAISIPTPASFLMGARSGGTADFANATFSEFRISRKALSAQEINLTFSKGRAYFSNEFMLNSSNFAAGDALRVEYTPKDSANYTGTIVNSSIVYVQNAVSPIPTINTPTGGSYNTTSTITWTAVTDADGDTVTYRVYENGTFNGSTTATSLTLNMTSEKTYAINISAFDGTDDSGNSTQVQFVFDNIAPSVTNTIFATTGGITTSPLLLGQSLDWIAATATDAFLNHVNLTLTDGSGVTVVNNQLMNNSGNNIWNYTTDVLLNGAGNWTVSISAYDNASNVRTNLTNITVNTQNVSTQEGLYGYSNDSLFSASDISVLSGYGYDIYEVSDNFSTLSSNWGTVLAAINASKLASALIGLNYKMDFNVSIPNDVNKSNTNITTYFPDLKKSPYVSVVAYISFELVNKTNYNDTDKTAALNSLATTAANAFINQFPVYSKSFNNSNLTSAVIKPTPLIYVYAGSQAELITNEQTLMRGNKSLNRIYVNLTAVLKTQAKSFQTNVIDQLRGTPNINNNLGNASVADIDGTVNDAVVFNVGASEIFVNINISNITGIAGKDVWDATQKKLLENNTDGSFDVNISAYSANLLFTEDIDHIQLTSLSSGKVFKASTPSVLSLNYTDGTRDDNYALYGANDARIELFDPTYVGNNFLTYYGWINASTVNLSNKIPYTTAIISDKLDKEIDKLNYSSTSWYGYISVADYANTNGWVSDKEGEVDAWINLNGSLNIFIDGLDTGIGGTNFSSRFKDVVDYVRITKVKKVILNTYTAYENFSTMGDGVMKESCIQRWNGADPAAPTSYSREEWTLELNRSKFFKNHNIPVFCQAFGNRTVGFNQLENYTDTLNIFYASKVLGYQNFYLSQPDFNYVHTIYAPNLGTDLAKDASTDDNVTYYRRYANGIVYYNTSSTQGWLSDGRQISGTKLCFDLWDNHANGVTFQFTVNREVTAAEAGDYNFSDSQIGGQGVWTTQCVTLNATHQNLGRWDVQAFVTPRTSIVGQGLNIGNAIVGYENRHSWYDSSTSPNSWTQYGMGQNWQINIEINDTKKASIDTVNTITQTEANATISAKLLQNITLSSGFNISMEVWGNPTFVNNSRFINLTYLSGSSFVLLYPQNNTDCDTDGATLNTTTIGGNPFKSCIMPSGNGYKIRVAPYKLSDQIFQANFQGNTAPTTPTIIFPSAGQATSLNRINYSSTDAEGDAITYYVSFNSTFNYSATINTTFNATTERTYAFNVSAYDGTEFSANSTTVQFVYDNSTPRIDNGSNSINTSRFLNRNSSLINYTFTEPFNHTFYIRNGTGGVVTNTTVNANDTYFWFNFTNLNDANYTFGGWINDTAGNTNITNNISVTVDTTFSVVALQTTYDTNNTFVSRNYITLNITVNETYIQNFTIQLKNGTATATTTNITGNATPFWNLINFTSLADGQYNITVTTEDKAGNRNVSFPNITITVDTTAPTISIQLPTEGSEVGSTVIFQYQVNDTNGVSQCNLTSNNMNGFTNGTALNVSNGNENNWVNDTGQPAGYQISFNIRCLDLAGNTAITPQRTFRIIGSEQPSPGSGSNFLGETTKKTVCKEGDQEISYKNLTYCVTCPVDGKVVVTDGKFDCLINTQGGGELQDATPPATPSAKGTIALFSLTIGSYILGGTDLILKGRKPNNRKKKPEDWS
ncbi:MAG: hypothetical protein HY376_02955 [Candidatus Blackburnbacteria bacterium]|nr:hypothetical protein [Candidatus Blackburnbacteria bacterium]